MHVIKEITYLCLFYRAKNEKNLVFDVRHGNNVENYTSFGEELLAPRPTRKPEQWRTEGGLGGSTPSPPPKCRGFDKAEPNSQFRGKYITNNLPRTRFSLIF